MIFKKLVGLLVFSVMAVSLSHAQEAKMTVAYNDCAAIYFNGVLLVDDYSPRGKCVLDAERKGELTLYTVALTERGSTKVLGLPFRVAIHNDRTKTYWMYTKTAVKNILLQDLVRECEEGDRLIFVTEDKKYALPHGEVELDYSSR